MISRKHKLLTVEIKDNFAKIGSQEKIEDSKNAIVVVKFFSPYNGWRWYPTEYSPKYKEFFGYVCGGEKEWGYFSLQELEESEYKGLPAIERDCSFKQKTLAQALKDDGYKYK